jgi:hypothetical protein
MTPRCSSCGREIPEGQGKSCSYCYGDPFYGKDGYLLEQMESDRRAQEEAEWADREWQRRIEEEQQREEK